MKEGYHKTPSDADIHFPPGKNRTKMYWSAFLSYLHAFYLRVKLICTCCRSPGLVGSPEGFLLGANPLADPGRICQMARNTFWLPAAARRSFSQVFISG